MDFTKEKWEQIKQNTDKWWADELRRPLIQARLTGCKPKRLPSKQPSHQFLSFYDLSVSAEQIVDAWDYELSSVLHRGDAFPHICPNFGPGVVAAYIGAELKNGRETVWFHPKQETELSNLNFEYLPDNQWFLRTKDIIKAAVDKWQGMVQIAVTDLGGNLDILSTFRPAEKLLYDLYDYPDEVIRLNWEIHKLWWRYFDELNSIVKDTNQGYSNWARIFSRRSHYILQCDFCYMLGPDMFEKFVKPELTATADKMENAFYHLDGPGQLVHLESLLEIDSIKGIQWVPGAGQSDATKWFEVYKKISKAGKKIYLSSKMATKPYEILDIIADQIGRMDNIVYYLDKDISEQQEVEKFLGKYF